MFKSSNSLRPTPPSGTDSTCNPQEVRLNFLLRPRLVWITAQQSQTDHSRCTGTDAEHIPCKKGREDRVKCPGPRNSARTTPGAPKVRHLDASRRQLISLGTCRRAISQVIGICPFISNHDTRLKNYLRLNCHLRNVAFGCDPVPESP